MIFISHKLHEVTAVSDRVTILRAGRAIATVGHGGHDAAVARVADGRPRRRHRSPRAPHGGGETRRARGRRRSGPTAIAACPQSRASRCRFAPARSSPSPASPATASASSPRRSQGFARRRRARFRSTARPLRAGDARAAFDAGVGYIPEDRLGTGVSPTLLDRDEPRSSAPIAAVVRAASAVGPDARARSRRRSATTTSRRQGPRWRPTTSRAATCRSS